MTDGEWGADDRESPSERPSPTEHTCKRCGTTFSVHGLRQRVTFEDFAESSGSFAQFRLCNPCWWYIYDAAHGKAAGTQGGDGA